MDSSFLAVSCVLGKCETWRMRRRLISDLWNKSHPQKQPVNPQAWGLIHC